MKPAFCSSRLRLPNTARRAASRSASVMPASSWSLSASADAASMPSVERILPSRALSSLSPLRPLASSSLRKRSRTAFSAWVLSSSDGLEPYLRSSTALRPSSESMAASRAFSSLLPLRPLASSSLRKRSRTASSACLSRRWSATALRPSSDAILSSRAFSSSSPLRPLASSSLRKRSRTVSSAWALPSLASFPPAAFSTSLEPSPSSGLPSLSSAALSASEPGRLSLFRPSMALRISVWSLAAMAVPTARPRAPWDLSSPAPCAAAPSMSLTPPPPMAAPMAPAAPPSAAPPSVLSPPMMAWPPIILKRPSPLNGSPILQTLTQM